jgi:oligopeptide transport system substrate-binding protein
MSKLWDCMQQVAEIAAFNLPTWVRKFCGNWLLRREIVCVALVMTAACDRQHHDRELADSARELRRGLPGEPRTLDPQLADDDFSLQVIRDLFEGLTSEDASGQTIPGIAESWSVDASGTVYVFHLRAGAKWSDGSQVTAEQFVRGLRRAVDPKTASGNAVLLEVIKGAGDVIAGKKDPSDLAVTALNHGSVEIDLEHPAPFILQILSQPIAAPMPDSDADHRSAVTGPGPYDGPYTLLERVPGSYITLGRNPNYWNASAVRIGKIRYVNAESEATELREYSADQLDMTFTIPLPDLARVSQKFGPQVQLATTLGTTYLAINLSQPALRKETNLREALSIAVDRDLIAQNVMNGVAPAYTFVAKGAGNYDPPKYEWVSWSRDRQLAYARSLFAKAGYSDRNPLQLRIYYPAGESIQRTMVAIAGSWKQNLGVTSELIADEFRVFLNGRKDRSRWDISRLKWDADYDDPESFLGIFSSDSNQNDPQYDNPQYSALLAKAKSEPNSDQRLRTLREAEQLLLNDYPIIPVYFTCSRRLVKPYVGGAKITPMNRTYSKNLYWNPQP